MSIFIAPKSITCKAGTTLLFTTDPWITQAWTVQIDLHADCFLNSECCSTYYVMRGWLNGCRVKDVVELHGGRVNYLTVRGVGTLTSRVHCPFSSPYLSPTWNSHLWSSHIVSCDLSGKFLTISWDALQKGPSADEWIRKLCYIYTMEYYSAIKKNTFESVLLRWMKLELIIQSEVSQKEKHQYSILTHMYRI